MPRSADGVPAVRLRDVVALLGTFPALAGADFELDPGDVVVLRGPNGAGKTTLLKVCAGLQAVASGTVEVAGCDLPRDRRLARRKIGLLTHETHLYGDLTAEENVRFATRASGGDVTRVRAALERVGLVGRDATSRTSQLSAGQKRRTALAVLIARSPQVWLLDEPHAGLDSEARKVLDCEIASAAAGGAGIVVVSHEPDVVVDLAASVMTMVGGRITARAERGSGVRDVA